MRILNVRMRNMLKDAKMRPGDVGQRAQLRQQIGKSNSKLAGKARLDAKSKEYAAPFINAVKEDRGLHVWQWQWSDSGDGGDGNKDASSAQQGRDNQMETAQWALAKYRGDGDVGEAPTRRGQHVFLARFLGTSVPEDHVGFKVKHVSAGNGSFNLQVTTPPDKASRMTFRDLREDQEQAIRRGDFIIAVNEAVVCNRTQQQQREILETESIPRTYVVLREGTGALMRSVTATLRGRRRASTSAKDQVQTRKDATRGKRGRSTSAAATRGGRGGKTPKKKRQRTATEPSAAKKSTRRRK
jgi:hypothetical protein